jgi:hypothetical protein
MDNNSERMSGVEEGLWQQIMELEAHHQHVRAQHEAARRRLDRASEPGVQARQDELQSVWRDYCAVIAELERSTAAFDDIRRAEQ